MEIVFYAAGKFTLRTHAGDGDAIVVEVLR
jgi:hypothetical protein